MSQNIELKNDRLTAIISTFGAEIMSVTDNSGKEFIWQADPTVWGRRGPVLFPICGGLKDNKYTLKGQEYTLEKHGFAKKSEFSVADKSDSHVALVLTESEETLAHYPYKFKLTVEFRLSQNSVEVYYITENLSDDTMYFSCGAHEGFSTPEGIENYKIVFEKPETLKAHKVEGSLLSDEYDVITENSNTFELDKKYFEVDALVFKELNSRSLTLMHKDGNRSIRYDFDGLDHLLLWQVCDAGYICIEPWSGLPDIVGTGFELENKVSITALESGKKCTYSHTISFN